jgi:hypothetical protein
VAAGDSFSTFTPVGRSWQTEDDVAIRFTEITRSLESLLNQASVEGGFLTSALLLVSERGERAAQALERSRKVGLAELYRAIEEKLRTVPARDSMLRGVLEGILLRLHPLVQGAAAVQYAAGDDAVDINEMVPGEPALSQIEGWGVAVLEGGACLDDFFKALLLGWAAWHLCLWQGVWSSWATALSGRNWSQPISSRCCWMYPNRRMMKFSTRWRHFRVECKFHELFHEWGDGPQALRAVMVVSLTRIGSTKPASSNHLLYSCSVWNLYRSEHSSGYLHCRQPILSSNFGGELNQPGCRRSRGYGCFSGCNGEGNIRSHSTKAT